jgi:hypothetical protein
MEKKLLNFNIIHLQLKTIIDHILIFINNHNQIILDIILLNILIYIFMLYRIIYILYIIFHLFLYNFISFF